MSCHVLRRPPDQAMGQQISHVPRIPGVRDARLLP